MIPTNWESLKAEVRKVLDAPDAPVGFAVCGLRFNLYPGAISENGAKHFAAFLLALNAQKHTPMIRLRSALLFDHSRLLEIGVDTPGQKKIVWMPCEVTEIDENSRDVEPSFFFPLTPGSEPVRVPLRRIVL